MNKKDILMSFKEEKKGEGKKMHPCRFCDELTDGERHTFTIGEKKIDTFICPQCKKLLNGSTICCCKKCGDLWLETCNEHTEPCTHKDSCKLCDPKNQIIK